MIQLEPTHSILSRLQTVPGTRVSQTQLKHVLLTQAIAQGPSPGDHLLTGQVFFQPLHTGKESHPEPHGHSAPPSRCCPFPFPGLQPVTSSSAAAAAPRHGSLSQGTSQGSWWLTAWSLPAVVVALRRTPGSTLGTKKGWMPSGNGLPGSVSWPAVYLSHIPLNTGSVCYLAIDPDIAVALQLAAFL